MLPLPLGNGNKSNDSLMKSGKTSEYKLKKCGIVIRTSKWKGALDMFLEL